MVKSPVSSPAVYYVWIAFNKLSHEYREITHSKAEEMGYPCLERSKAVVKGSSCVSLNVIDKKREPNPSFAGIWQFAPMDCLIDKRDRRVVCRGIGQESRKSRPRWPVSLELERTRFFSGLKFLITDVRHTSAAVCNIGSNPKAATPFKNKPSKKP
jgi:hypothetical protein